MAYFKNNNGSAFMIVIISMAVLLILATTIASIAACNFEMSHAERRYQAAYYVAEAGIRHQIEHMRLRMEELHRSGGHTNAGTFFTAFNQGWIATPLIMQNLGVDSARADIILPPPEVPSITGTGNKRIYTFDCRATVGNVRRTIRGSVTIEWALMQPPPVFFAHTLFSHGRIYMSDDSRIGGDAGTNANTAGAVELNNEAQITGNLIIGHGSGANVVNNRNRIRGNVIVSTSVMPMPQIFSPTNLTNRGALDLRDEQNRRISSNASYTSISLRDDSSLTIDLGGGDLLIRTGSLSLIDDSMIIINGMGRLYLFVDGQFEISDDAKINYRGIPGNLVILISGSNPVQVRNDTLINGAIYAPNTSFTIADDAEITGSIMVNEIFMRDDAVITFSQINHIGLAAHLSPIPGFVPPERMFIINSWREP